MLIRAKLKAAIIAGALALALMAPGGLSAGARYPESEKEGCEALIRRVHRARFFPHIEKRCFTCELETDDGRSWAFALRFNQDACGGDSPSTLLDRYLVMQRSPVILWYDTPEDRYLAWEAAAEYYRRARKKRASK